MHADGNDNATIFEATSGNGRTKTFREADLDYLAGEAQSARMAVRASLSELKATMLSRAHPRELTRRHPRVAIGLAVVAGVTAGVTAGALARRRRRRPKASSPPPADAGLAESSRPEKSKPRGRAGAGFDKLFELAVMALRWALVSALKTALRSGLAAWSAQATAPGSAAGTPADAVTPDDVVSHSSDDAGTQGGAGSAAACPADTGGAGCDEKS
jgi:hypothetical protein